MNGDSQFHEDFIESLQAILFDGGILMIPLSILSFVIFGLGFALLGYFFIHRFFRLDRKTIQDCVEHPEKAEGELALIIAYARDAGVRTVEDVQNRFAEMRNVYLSGIDSRRALLLTLVTAAPLLGLLGTVMGMLTTFSGLAVSTGGKTVDQVADGISEALITTQTGLIIAIPGYVLASAIQKRRNQMASCLTALETLLVQRLRKEQKP